MSRETIEAVKDLPIDATIGASMKLHRAGAVQKGCCPFHGEKTPSFVVYRDHFHCFGCGEHGDGIAFVQKQESVDFAEAVRRLAQRNSIAIIETAAVEDPQFERKTELKAVLSQAQRLFTEGSAQAVDYWKKRGFSEDTVNEFGLGYTTGDLSALHTNTAVLIESGLQSEDGKSTLRQRFTIPIADHIGNIIAFAGRAEGEAQPKYLNFRETALYKKNQTLYNLHRARRFVRTDNRVFVTEGYPDVMMLHQEGYPNAVCVGGTAFAENQINELKRLSNNEKPLEIVLIFNGDAAGVKATLKYTPELLRAGFSVKVAELPIKDVCDYVTHGYDLKLVLLKAKDAVQFVFEKSHNEDLTPVEFGELTNQLARLIANVRNDQAKTRYTDLYAAYLSLDASKFRRQVAAGGATQERFFTPNTEGSPSSNGAASSKLKEDDDFQVGDFPLSVFPQKIQNIIQDCHKYLSYPKDFTAAGILAATSIALGRRVRAMHVWEQGTALYMALVAPPGTNKSNPLDFAIHPIRKWDEREYKEYKHKFEEFSKDAASNPRPILKKIIYGDFTIESLGQNLDHNRRGITVVNDELRGFFKSFGRYTGGGGEQEKWLENWSEQPLNVTRSGRSIYIKRPNIPIIGTTQPSVLDELGKDGRSVTGFVERFLYVIPEDVPILKIKKRKDRGGVEYSHMASRYTPIMTRLLDITAPEATDSEDDLEWHILYMDEAADDMLTDYINKLKDKMGEHEDEYKRNIFSKMQNYAIRFALILECLNWATEDNEFQLIQSLTITPESVHHAITLCSYFLQNAMKANSMINFSSPVDKLPKNFREFYRMLPDEFATGDAEDIAAKKDIRRATFYRLLKREELFQKLRGGRYQKLHY